MGEREKDDEMDKGFFFFFCGELRRRKDNEEEDQSLGCTEKDGRER